VRSTACGGCAAWQILPEIGEPERAAVEIQSVAVKQAYRRLHLGTQIVTRILHEVRRFEPAQAIVLTFAPKFSRPRIQGHSQNPGHA
jgi:N-acetylglutamate synthase-like GNAT family acetyltransferase